MSKRSVRLLALVVVVLLAACASNGGPDQGLAELDLDKLTGFRLDRPENNESYTELDKPGQARFIVERLLEQRTLLDENTEVDDTPSRDIWVYLLTLLGQDDTVLATARLVYRYYPYEEKAVFLEDGADWYRIPEDLLDTIRELATTPTVSLDDFNPQHVALFKEYGWHPFSRLNNYEYRLPQDLTYRVGEFPTVLFWAHRNALSNLVGLDLRPYLGKTVQITIYQLDRDIPYLGPPNGVPRAVIVNAGADIVGGWVDKGRHSGEAVALNEEQLEPDEEFLLRFTDTSDPLVQELAVMEPVEVMRTYWEAVDSGDYRRARACETLRSTFGALFSGMDNTRHANESFSQAELLGLDNYESVEFVRAEPYLALAAPQTDTEKEFKVELVVDFKKEGFFSDGQVGLYGTVRKTPIGWRIECFGTGP